MKIKVTNLNLKKKIQNSMSTRPAVKQMLISMKEGIDTALKQGEKPLEAIKLYHQLLAKYKTQFTAEHEKEVEDLAKEFGGEIIN